MKFGVLKFAGLIAGAIVVSAGAQAAPVPPILAQIPAAPAANIEQAVASQNEVVQCPPIQVRWHRHHHRWGHHHWRHHRWHHRHWRHRR